MDDYATLEPCSSLQSAIENIHAVQCVDSTRLRCLLAEDEELWFLNYMLLLQVYGIISSALLHKQTWMAWTRFGCTVLKSALSISVWIAD